jgi:hypothetical protein
MLCSNMMRHPHLITASAFVITSPYNSKVSNCCNWSSVIINLGIRILVPPPLPSDSGSLRACSVTTQPPGGQMHRISSADWRCTHKTGFIAHELAIKLSTEILNELHFSHWISRFIGQNSASYLGNPGFNCHLEDHLFWLRFSWFPWVPPGKYFKCLKLGHDRFLPHPLKFVVN